jgi:predicted nucleic acid-binding protein
LRFWDSSALVPLLTLEPTSSRMLELYQIDPALLVWWGTEVELASALARLEREGTLQPEEADQAFTRLTRLKSAWHEVLPSEEVRETARRFLRVHFPAGHGRLATGSSLRGQPREAFTAQLCLPGRTAVGGSETGGIPGTQSSGGLKESGCGVQRSIPLRPSGSSPTPAPQPRLARAGFPEWAGRFPRVW